MASAFWILEDGRGFARKWGAMAHLLDLISQELRHIPGAEEFYAFLDTFVYREDRGDIPDGCGGFIRQHEHLVFNFDLRTFAPKNRQFFWQATQKALTSIKTQQHKEDEGIAFLLMILLDMHKRIKHGEDPMLLNDLRLIQPMPLAKIGPGW